MSESCEEGKGARCGVSEKGELEERGEEVEGREKGGEGFINNNQSLYPRSSKSPPPNVLTNFEIPSLSNPSKRSSLKKK